MDRPNGGWARGFSHGIGIEVQQAPAGRTQLDRQEENWPIPTERRENEMERHESPRTPPPPVTPPTEDRLFTDWSSIDFPRERTSQHNIELNINQPDNQTDQSGSQPTRIETAGNIIGDVVTYSSTCRQPSQVGVRLMDRETYTSEVELRTQGEEIRVNILNSDNRGTQIPTSHSAVSSHENGNHRRLPHKNIY